MRKGCGTESTYLSIQPKHKNLEAETDEEFDYLESKPSRGTISREEIDATLQYGACPLENFPEGMKRGGRKEYTEIRVDIDRR